MSECAEKAVHGCNTIVKRKNLKEHVVTAASTHSVLQAREVQRLRGVIYFKVSRISHNSFNLRRPNTHQIVPLEKIYSTI